MAKIHVLDKAVAELIAAGEVVERPSSIVKELLENAIDAGAENISVEIKDGGIRYIRVTDDGCGIERDDIPRAFLRHATSKVRRAEDLGGIRTLGFRGEALASVAAMCRVELTSKTKQEQEGSTYCVEGGELIDFRPAGCPDGTTIIVRDVFFNTPARMKFLKKDVAEGNSVAQVVDKCALSHPEIAFRFIRDGQTRMQTSGNADLLSTIFAIYGRDMANNMLPVAYTSEDGIQVTGYISSPKGAKPTRIYQNFFINKRFVRTRTGSAALEEACKGKLMTGRFPACVLNITIAEQEVDVNVHPAKIEVRFTKEKPVFSAVYYAVKSALSKLAPPIPTRELTQELAENKAEEPEPIRMSAQEYRNRFVKEETQEPSFSKPSVFAQTTFSQNLFSRPLSMAASKNLDISVEDEREPKKSAYSSYFDQIPPPQRDTIKKVPSDASSALEQDSCPPSTSQVEEEMMPDCKLVGEVLGTYMILEQGDDILFVDKHAAHERLLYEKLRNNLSYGNRQVLLSPQTVRLPPEHCAAILEQPEILGNMGFAVEDFGGNTILIREVPIELAQGDIEAIVADVAAKLAGGYADLTPDILDKLLFSIACKSAVRAHDRTCKEELEEIVRRLAQNPQITHCPHGRPVTVRLTRIELEKMFGRLG